MAIVINSSPGNYSSAHGDLIFTVYESTKANDPATYPDYKYVADIYINGSQVKREKSVPHPTHKRGVFNIGPTIQNYVASVFNPNSTNVKAQESGANEFFVDVQVKFGEEYNLTIYPNLLTDSTRTYFNHYNGRQTGGSTILSNYLNKPISLRPLVTSVNSLDAFVFIPYFPTSTSTISVMFESYNNGGTSPVDSTLFNITPSAANVMQLLNVSPARYTAVSPGALFGRNRYTVNINGTKYTFNMECEAKYQNYTLHFLNRFGGFDSKDFSKVSRKTLDIQKKNFAKLPYVVDSNGQVSYHNANKVYNEVRSTYSSQYTEKLQLNTDILTDAEYQWLSDLVLSPLVYLEENGYFIPVDIKATNYDFKKVVNDKLTNLTLDIEIGQTFNAQNR